MKIYTLNYVKSDQDVPAPFYVQEHHPKRDVQKETRGKLY